MWSARLKAGTSCCRDGSRVLVQCAAIAAQDLRERARLPRPVQGHAYVPRRVMSAARKVSAAEPTETIVSPSETGGGWGFLPAHNGTMGYVV